MSLRFTSGARFAALVVAAVAAPAVADAQTLAHQYFLAGSYADALGGPALTPNGGTLGASGYTFGANQGLTTAFTQASPFSIVLRFSFAEITGFRKIVDFKGLTSDNGAYVLNGNDNFYNHVTSATTPFAPGTLAQFVLTRDALGTVAGYVNGVQDYTYPDAASMDAVFTTNANLFIDDAVTSGREASSGFVNYVAFYNGALSAQQIAGLTIPTPGTSTVPEPTTLALVGAGVVTAGLLRRRRAA